MECMTCNRVPCESVKGSAAPEVHHLTCEIGPLCSLVLAGNQKQTDAHFGGYGPLVKLLPLSDFLAACTSQHPGTRDVSEARNSWAAAKDAGL